jgi:hypothetical protein
MKNTKGAFCFRPFAEGILQHSKMSFALPALIWNSAMDLLQFLVRFPDYKVLIIQNRK